MNEAQPTETTGNDKSKLPELSPRERYYSQFGFQETGRAKFDPYQAPANWDTKKHGTPDVVFMKWNSYPVGGEKAALRRAWDKTTKSWIPVTRAQ